MCSSSVLLHMCMLFLLCVKTLLLSPVRRHLDKVPYGKCIQSFLLLFLYVIQNCHDTHKALLSLLITSLSSLPDCLPYKMESILNLFYEYSILGIKKAFNKYLNKVSDKHLIFNSVVQVNGAMVKGRKWRINDPRYKQRLDYILLLGFGASLVTQW